MTITGAFADWLNAIYTWCSLRASTTFHLLIDPPATAASTGAEVMSSYSTKFYAVCLMKIRNIGALVDVNGVITDLGQSEADSAVSLLQDGAGLEVHEAHLMLTHPRTPQKDDFFHHSNNKQ